MEVFHYYRGYGIRYSKGETTVEDNGLEIKKYYDAGIAGRIKAEKYIDQLMGEKINRPQKNAKRK